MSSLLAQTIQPPLLTLLSSTSQSAISPLFKTHCGPSSSKSIITTINDITTSASSASSAQRKLVPRHMTRGTLVHPVNHLQSSDLRSTYIQIGKSVSTYRNSKGKARESIPLGATLPWVNLQIRTLGRRGFSFEIGFVDTKGQEGIIRCSSFKREPSLHADRDIPLLHLPLSLPAKASSITPWLDVSLNLNALIPIFHTVQRHMDDQERNADDDRPRKRMRLESGTALPSGRLGSISYIRIYANCRIRRVWLSEDGQRTLEALGQAGQYDFGLFASRSSLELSRRTSARDLSDQALGRLVAETKDGRVPRSAAVQGVGS